MLGATRYGAQMTTYRSNSVPMATQCWVEEDFDAVSRVLKKSCDLLQHSLRVLSVL